MKKHSSFTLIEVLLAVFILEVGLLGIAGFYASSLKIIKTARNETIASNLASGILDEQLAISYDNLEIGQTEKNYTEDISSPFHDWTQKVEIRYVDANLNQQETETHMKKIVVTISWPEVNSQKSFQTASIKAEH